MPAHLQFYKRDPDGLRRGAGYYYKRYGKRGRLLKKAQRQDGTFIIFPRKRRVYYTVWSKTKDGKREAEYKYGKNRNYMHAGDNRKYL